MSTSAAGLLQQHTYYQPASNSVNDKSPEYDIPLRRSQLSRAQWQLSTCQVKAYQYSRRMCQEGRVRGTTRPCTGLEGLQSTNLLLMPARRSCTLLDVLSTHQTGSLFTLEFLPTHSAWLMGSQATTCKGAGRRCHHGRLAAYANSFGSIQAKCDGNLERCCLAEASPGVQFVSTKVMNPQSV